MHHTATLLPDNSIIVVGGRKSPTKPNDKFYRLVFSNHAGQWSKIDLDKSSDVFMPRWRHTSNTVDFKGLFINR